MRHTMLGYRAVARRGVAALGALVLALGLCACGGGVSATSKSSPQSGTEKSARTEKTAETPSSRSVRGLLGDGDHDNPNDLDGDEHPDGDPDSDTSLAPKTYEDSDDSAILSSGKAAPAPQERAIAALVKRYYAALAAGRGSRACALMAPTLAETLAEAYGGGGGPAFLRGAHSCTAIVSLDAAHLEHQLRGVVAVTGVRIEGETARALLGSTTMPASYLGLLRVAGTWRIAALAAVRLP
jgi:hypothetical protein